MTKMIVTKIILILLMFGVSLSAYEVKTCDYYREKSKEYRTKSTYANTSIQAFRYHNISNKYFEQFKECNTYKKGAMKRRYKGYR